MLVTAAWSQFHTSLFRQWSCLSMWGMGPLSPRCWVLPVMMCLHNYGKNLCKNTIEVLITHTFFQILQLCRSIFVSCMIMQCPQLSHIDARVFVAGHVNCWTNKRWGEVSDEIPLWPPQSVAMKCGQPPQWHYSQYGPAVPVMISLYW